MITAPETFSQTIERAFTARDIKENIPLAFQVPPGTGKLIIHFAYTPKIAGDIANLLTLTIFDPSGWRGEGHRQDDPIEIILSQDEASPGFIRGGIQAGEWSVVINTHMIAPGEPCATRLSLRGLAQSAEIASQQECAPMPATGQPSHRGPGWYRGDLHAHTKHSDAAWDAAALAGDARAQNLDFVTLSDHNTISGLAGLESACDGGPLPIGGMELTTFWGHALALGLHGWVDWRSTHGESGRTAARGMDAICREVTERGGLFIIAHPMALGDPYCTGCDWRFPDAQPGPARAVEVWNGDWYSDSNNEKGLLLAYRWLNQGYRLALTAGSDNHGHPGEQHDGFDVVYAEGLSEGEILNAVRAGRLYLSAGPRLELAAISGQQQALMGDVLAPEAGVPIRLEARWLDCPPGSELAWIVDGEAREREAVENQGAKTWIIPGGSAHWSLVTLRGPSGRMLALTNPIYFDGRS